MFNRGVRAFLLLLTIALAVSAVGSVSLGSNQTVSTMQTATITCSASGFTPSNYTWYLDGAYKGTNKAGQYKAWGNGPMWQGPGNDTMKNSVYVNYKDSSGVGNHTVKCVAKSTNGAQYSNQMTLTVQNKPPTASIVVNPGQTSSIAYGSTLQVNITIEGRDLDGKIMKYYIDFGDGIRQLEATYTNQATAPKKITYSVFNGYTTSGTFTVTGKITDDSGAVTTTTTKIKIKNVLPNLVFNGVDCTDGGAPVGDCYFNFTGSSDPDGSIRTILVIIDGDTYSAEHHSVADEGLKIKAKSALANGDHDVRFRIWDNATTGDYIDYPVGVTDGSGTSPVAFSVTNQRPTIGPALQPNGTPLSLNPTIVEKGDSVSFAVNASDSDGHVVNYLWDFGDGSTATTNSSSVSHTYNSYPQQGNSYAASVIAVDDNGAKSHPYAFTVQSLGQASVLYTFDDCAFVGGYVPDKSGSHDAKLLDTGSHLSSAVTSPKGSGCVLYADGNQVKGIEAAASQDYAPNSFTISFWLFSGGAGRGILQNGNNYNFGQNGGGNLVAKFPGLSGSPSLTGSYGTVVAGVHYAITYDSSAGSLKLYENGQLSTSTTASGTLSDSSALAIAGSVTGYSWLYYYKFDQFRIYNYAMDSGRISKLYSIT